MKVDLQEIDELLHNSNLSEVAKAVGIPYRTLQAWKLGENKWWADTQDKLTKLQNYVNDSIEEYASDEKFIASFKNKLDEFESSKSRFVLEDSDGNVYFVK